MDYKGEKIVFIEYHDRNPWQVITELNDFSFELIS
jgi:hypothetical protein